MEKTPGQSSPSKRSLIGLDGLNFAIADVCDGVGPFLSICLKFVVQAFGYPTGFLTLAAIALIALVFFALLMPET
jgi:hypothetical protein